MAYSDKVVDHFNHPRNMGSFPKEDPQFGTGMVGAPECGDVMKLQIKVQDDTIVDAKFKTFGCGSAIASSSLATEWLKGKRLRKPRRSRTPTSYRNSTCRRSRSIARFWLRTRSKRRCRTFCTNRRIAHRPPRREKRDEMPTLCRTHDAGRLPRS